MAYPSSASVQFHHRHSEWPVPSRPSHVLRGAARIARQSISLPCGLYESGAPHSNVRCRTVPADTVLYPFVCRCSQYYGWDHFRPEQCWRPAWSATSLTRPARSRADNAGGTTARSVSLDIRGLSDDRDVTVVVAGVGHPFSRMAAAARLCDGRDHCHFRGPSNRVATAYAIYGRPLPRCLWREIGRASCRERVLVWVRWGRVEIKLI